MISFLGTVDTGLLSVFVQNIVDMIVDYALWVAVLKKEFSKIMEGRL